jgi:hypothetical protein
MAVEMSTSVTTTTLAILAAFTGTFASVVGALEPFLLVRKGSTLRGPPVTIGELWALALVLLRSGETETMLDPRDSAAGLAVWIEMDGSTLTELAVVIGELGALVLLRSGKTGTNWIEPLDSAAGTGLMDAAAGSTKTPPAVVVGKLDPLALVLVRSGKAGTMIEPLDSPRGIGVLDAVDGLEGDWPVFVTVAVASLTACVIVTTLTRPSLVVVTAEGACVGFGSGLGVFAAELPAAAVAETMNGFESSDSIAALFKSCPCAN